jgi:hypothetical protein
MKNPHGACHLCKCVYVRHDASALSQCAAGQDIALIWLVLYLR